MWRYFVGAGAAALLVVAGMFLFRGSASTEPTLPRPPALQAGAEAEPPLPEEAPRATLRTREQKRFDRYDKDRDQSITREEYLRLRRRAFARLDKDRDGKLSFEEWAARTTDKFAGADKDKSGALSRAEFATTAPKPRAAKAKCVCAPPPAATPGEEED